MLSWWEVRSKWSGSNLPFTYKRPKMVSQERVLECGCFSKKCAVKTVVISRESDIRWWLERDKDLEEAVNYQRHLGCRSTHKLWLTNWEGCVWRLLFLSLRDLRFSVDDRYLSRGWLFNRKDSIFWESLQTQFSWSEKGFFCWRGQNEQKGLSVKHKWNTVTLQVSRCSCLSSSISWRRMLITEEDGKECSTKRKDDRKFLVLFVNLCQQHAFQRSVQTLAQCFLSLKQHQEVDRQSLQLLFLAFFLFSLPFFFTIVVSLSFTLNCLMRQHFLGYEAKLTC